MAGETSAELTIVVRAQDAATRVIDGIGRTIGRVLMTPLTAVGKAVTGIFKQFFGLKSLLVGGGLIAAVNGLVQGLSKAAIKYEPLFSDATQSKIDETATAFNKLGASFRQTFGVIITEFDVAGWLNSVSDWLRDNKDTIIGTIKQVGDMFEYVRGIVVSLTGAIASGLKDAFMSVGDFMWGPNGLHPQAPVPYKPNPWTGGIGSGGVETLEGAASRPSAEASADWSKFYDNVSRVHRETAAFGAESRKTTEIVKAVAVETDKAAESTGKLADAYHEVAKVAKAAIIAFEEVADVIAGNVTDGLFAFIEGTQSAGRAFASMVSSILRELGRLLLYRSLLGAILGLAGGAAGAASGSGGAFTSESGTAGFTSTAFASGGPVRRGGVATVGENGPEQVFLPRGAEVVPSQRSRAMGGGDTINVYGARDPKATAREVAYERRRSAGLRRALA